MFVSRRKFLTAGAASAAVVTGASRVPQLLLSAAAAGSDPDAQQGPRVLIVIQLSGGNDGLNTVVPYADDQYHRNRFQTRINAGEVRKIDDYVGLHPAMEGVHRLYQEGQVGIVQGIGYENPNRSHFESMDIWHTARPAATNEGARQVGWLGKVLDGVAAGQKLPAGGDTLAVHLGREVQPLALAGLRVTTPSIGEFRHFQFDQRGGADLAATRKRLIAGDADGDELVRHIRAAAQSAVASSQRVRAAMDASRVVGDYPATELGKKLRGIAQLIKAGLATKIYYVTLDGFDTHSLQAESHAGLLRELSGAATALMDDLTEAGHAERTLIACFSEFGRRVQENASRGTDHGAAAPMFLLGGRLRGGLTGAHPSLDDLQDGDLQFHTDFRSVYAAILDQWLAVDSRPLLGGEFPKLDLFTG